jgi:hypothetical protein
MSGEHAGSDEPRGEKTADGNLWSPELSSDNSDAILSNNSNAKLPDDATPAPPAEGLVPEEERRSQRRRRTLLPGTVVLGDQGAIVHGDGLMTLNCVIRNVTDNGAQVRVKGLDLLPKTLKLIDIRGYVVYDAEVKWRRGDDVGLSLTHRILIEDMPIPISRIFRVISEQARQRLDG